ncbi:MAG TPA: hypothetical protein VIV06_00785 [Candidatus Limnocylindrales bacterium]
MPIIVERTVERPMGPATTFHALGGLCLAIHEPTRPRACPDSDH